MPPLNHRAHPSILDVFSFKLIFPGPLEGGGGGGGVFERGGGELIYLLLNYVFKAMCVKQTTYSNNFNTTQNVLRCLIIFFQLFMYYTSCYFSENEKKLVENLHLKRGGGLI